MENMKKWVPPPPSKPPPENIGRSGRVPLPKGGPTSSGGARVGNPYRIYLRDAERDIMDGVALSEDTSGCADKGRESRPCDQESASKESGRGGSFGSSDSSERNAKLVTVPAAARRRRSNPQHHDSSSGGDFAASSVPGTPSPNDTDDSGWRRRGEGEQNSRLDPTDDQKSRESTASWSSDYDQETTKSGRPVDDPSEKGNEGRRQRESPRRRGKSGDSFHRSRNRWRSESTSDSDLGGEGLLRVARDGTNGTKERSRREDTAREDSQKDQYPEDAGESGDQESRLSCSDVENRKLSDPSLPSEDAGSPSSTCRRGSNEGHQLHRGERKSRKYGQRGSVAEDASETAQVYGLSRNGESSQGAGLESGAGDGKLERCSSSALTRKRRDSDDVDAGESPPTWCPDADPHQTSAVDAGSAPGSRKSSTGSSEGYAEVSRGHGRTQPIAGREDGTTGEIRHSAALDTGGVVGGAEGGGISSSPLPGKDVSSRTESMAGNPPPPGPATAGKPIRGARWGEAIGVRSKVFDTTTIPTGRANVRDFVCSPLRSGPGTVLRCFVERNRSGAHRFSKVYSIYADLEDGSGRLLLTARKLLASKTAYYIICSRHDDLFQDEGKRGGRSFLAKLRATSAAHKEYALYDSGDNPSSAAATETKEFLSKDGFSSAKEKESKSRQNSSEHASATPLERGGEGREELRRELAVIIYHFDKKEERTGKRRMEVAIPQIRQQGDAWEQVLWQPCDTKHSINLNFDRIRHQGAQNLLEEERLLVFHQRESRYDPLSSCLVDFRGRATAPSVKNFQLIKSAPEDTIKRAYYYSEGAGKAENESDDYPKPVYLQMGKVGKDCFNVDVEWPLSLLQAFAICLSRFDTKAHF